MRSLPLSLLGFVVACRCPSYEALTEVRMVQAMEVRAASPELADRVARAVQTELVAVRTKLGDGGRVIDRGLIYVLGVAGNRARGTTFADFVELRVGANATDDHLRYLVAHELTHYLAGDGCHRLPAVLEEGLCELIAQSVVPECGVSRRVEHAVNLATAIQHEFRSTYPLRVGSEVRLVTWTLKADIELSSMPDPMRALRLSRRELIEVEPESNQQALTSFGYLLATRIGLDRLVELSREHRQGEGGAPSPAVLLAAAELDAANPSAWMSHVMALVTAEDVSRALQSPAARSRVTVDWE